MTQTREISVRLVTEPLLGGEVRKYCQAHPGGPASTCRPEILFSRGRYVALFGPSIEHGIIGFGTTVASALRAFDKIAVRCIHFISQERSTAEKAQPT